MTVAGALFSGIGGFCIGFENAGIKTTWAVDSDAHAIQTYSENIRCQRVLCRDVRNLRAKDLEPVDILQGEPFVHLGRETVQNSLDALLAEPVKVKFSKFTLAVEEIPSVDQLRNAVHACQESSSTESAKAKEFFDTAATMLKKPIQVLKVEDFNTKGLMGPCQNGTPFFALLKATGQSRKGGEEGDSLGSFGIGKYAPFTLSRLRTLFISTVWKDKDGNFHHYVQGKSRLMSFTLDGKTFKGTGFWGEVEKCQPVIGDKKNLPEWLRRGSGDELTEQDLGTSLFILGFPTDAKNWEAILAATIAENFFGAIHEGKLVVEIGSEYVIDKTSLEEIFTDQVIKDALTKTLGSGASEAFSDAYLYYLAITSDQAKREFKEQLHLGQMELRILVREQTPKKVAVLRSGMFITDGFEGLKRFPDFKDFIAVLRCVNAKGNHLLREMEPPRHDSFEPARLMPKRLEEQARSAVRETAKWVREMLKRHARDPVADVTKIDELAEFFADEQQEATDGQRNEVNPAGAIKIAAKKVAPPESQSIKIDNSSSENDESSETVGGSGSDGEQGDAGNDGQHGGEGSAGDLQGSSGGEGKGANEDSGAGKKHITLRNVRSFQLSDKKRRISFSPSEGGKLSVKVFAAGADSNRPLTIASTSQGALKGGAVEGVSVKADQRVFLRDRI
jgi:hypothetical protein